MAPKIHIAYIIDRIDAGGTGRQLQLLLEGIDRNRFACNLFLLKGDLAHPQTPRGIPAEVIGVDSLMSINGIRKANRLAGRFRDLNIQIVQTFFQDATFLGILAAVRAKIPAKIVSIRDLLFWASPLTFGAYRIAAATADRVLVNSSAVKARASNFVPANKIHVIPNGIPLNHQSQGQPDDRSILREFDLPPDIPLVVLVSNCNRRVKRVELMIESILFVRERHSAHFMLVGDGHLRAELVSRSRDLGIADHITFAGQRQDIDHILSNAEIALNTSDSEGLSNAVMEAMGAGLPIVASDVSGNRELIHPYRNGLLFKPGDAKDLAQKINWLLDDRQRCRKFGAAGRQRIEDEFSVDKMVAHHEIFYETLVDRLEDS